MTAQYFEMLDKAAQSAQMFEDELRELYHNSIDPIAAMFFFELLEQTKVIKQKLNSANKKTGKQASHE